MNLGRSQHNSVLSGSMPCDMDLGPYEILEFLAYLCVPGAAYSRTPVPKSEQGSHCC